MTGGVDWMRGRAAGFLTDACQILAHTSGSDFDPGQPSGDVPGPVTPCRVVAVRRLAAETPQGGLITAVNRWNIYLPIGTAITPADRIRHAGHDYEVTDVSDDQTASAFVAVLAERVR